MFSWLRESAIFLIRRIISIIIVLLGVCTIAFIITRMLGNPVYLLVGQQADQEILDNLIHQMGLDRPLYEQYFRYLGTVLQGDFGISRYTYRPVLDEIAFRLPATLELVLAAMTITIVFAIPLGILAAARPGSIFDRLCALISQFGVSMPNFWVGLIFIYVFYFLLKILPAPLGRLDATLRAPAEVTRLFLIDSIIAGNFVTFKSALSHLILPAVTLSLSSAPSTLQITRTALIHILSSDYIRTARAYGMPNRSIYYRYALKNAIVPIITMLAMTFGFLMSGTVLVETVFNWPGLGLYAVDSMHHFDYEPIVGVVFLSALFYVLAYLVADIITYTIDPRIRAE